MRYACIASLEQRASQEFSLGLYGRSVLIVERRVVTAGQAHQLAPPLSAEEITQQLGREAKAAIAGAAARLAIEVD